MTDGNPDIIHTIPINDIIDHDTDGDGCVCIPEAEAVFRDDGLLRLADGPPLTRWPRTALTGCTPTPATGATAVQSAVQFTDATISATPLTRFCRDRPWIGRMLCPPR